MEQLLIIEDDIGLNQGLSKALKADDRQIISCQDLKTAKEQLLCGGVSLILLDINLPDGSGLELLREVKENMPGVPVILLTANDTDLDIVDGLERGADDYITKPFSLSVLRARVVYPWFCWISICRMAVGLSCSGRSRKTRPGFLLFY